jgi:hypothetical protein
MPGTTPLYNVKLQSALDLNGQGLTGTTPSKRFILKNIGASDKTIDVSDMGRLLKFSGSVNLSLNSSIAGVTAGDTFIATTDSLLNLTGTATRLNCFVDSYADAITQFVYLGSNTWGVLNIN